MAPNRQVTVTYAGRSPAPASDLDQVASVPLVVTGRAEGDRVVVTLAGELTIGTVQLAEHAIHRARLEHGEHLVLNLEPLTFLDSMGLRTLVKYYLAAEGRGGSAVLAGPLARQVARALSFSGLDRRLSLSSTLAHAMAEAHT